MARIQIIVARGDDLPIVELELRAPDGTTPNLTGATVQLRYRPAGNTAATVVVRNMSIMNGPAAVVRYVWQSGGADTIAAGHYDAQVRVTFPDGKRLTFPNEQYMDLWMPEAL